MIFRTITRDGKGIRLPVVCVLHDGAHSDPVYLPVSNSKFLIRHLALRSIVCGCGGGIERAGQGMDFGLRFEHTKVEWTPESEQEVCTRPAAQ